MPRQKPVFETLSSTRRSGLYRHRSLVLLAVLLLPPAKLLLNTTSNSRIITSYLLAINIATFAVYRHDKFAAARQDGSRRVRETTLQLWALAGGWPGAWVAQRMLRHKTRKVGFLVVFYFIVAVEVGGCLRLLGWL